MNMKRVINGKRYDTTTAQPIAEHSHRYPGDFEYYDETLYRKKTGEFFLAGEGGPMSKYARAVDHNTRSGGKDIIPITEDMAKEWVERYEDFDTYESIFGPVDE